MAKQKKIAYKDEFVTIKWDDIENWADDIYSAELYAVCDHKDKNKAKKILAKYGVNEDDVNVIYHYNLIRYLSDIICGLSIIVTNQKKQTDELRNDAELFLKHFAKI